MRTHAHLTMCAYAHVGGCADTVMRYISNEQVRLIVTRGRALGDATRVRILDLLARSEQPVGQLAIALQSDPSSISKHLQVLFHARLVERRREASTVIYSIAAAGVADVCRYLAVSELSAKTIVSPGASSMNPHT